MTDPTMTDVAREAGVGVATVDRVINRRARVREDTAQRVLAAAEKLGFRRTGLIRRRIDERTGGYRFGFILQRPTGFYTELGRALEAAPRAQASALGQIEVTYLDQLGPQQVAVKVEEMARQNDALALVAADHPAVNQAIDRADTRGVPVFAMISDLSAAACAGYVSVDHRKMGRTAAWAISRLASHPGKVALILGSHRYLCQEQSEIGFRSYLREQAPGFQLLETLVSLESTELAEAATLELLKRHPDLRGIYVAGGGIEGVVQALSSESGPQGLVTVCHDLSSLTRQALIDGQVDMVLSHPYDMLAARLIAAMTEAADRQQNGGKLQIILPFVSYTAANI